MHKFQDKKRKEKIKPLSQGKNSKKRYLIQMRGELFSLQLIICNSIQS